ncbi:related to serine/threonine-protein phosphatase 2A activator 1 [Ramularia collo-cygni]|uniref:Serine/threonine-protein phosphatase 2A activator n=1 Tax=Ramularia collo-cygni TaxID=112498 RepID=A0A2D3V860_9PEZI|nr:related to serine/threonine-protein phosphatase 2A activator 1 [Ramularia collo-cygni]CZT16543.1 related to serine/threonine-protein phosphatase 2A activator 1 [Ramularia collo-cygni]
MYFSAIQFIHDVKTGPFWEHSPVLYDISGIKDGWGKINKGMLKMYAAEVLGKFPVVQHFPFGSMFQWVRDPDAVAAPSTFHARQQPSTIKTEDVSSGQSASVSGTKAPWAQPGVGMPQMQAATGMPTTRAPWAGRPSAGLRTSMPAPAPRRSLPKREDQ